ncbi:MAG: hypothetical protein A3E01_02765 [Gammaproteobacteria bacterium RIFCSPHIGHO2_12_FULL_63_22]|nr:MAG: hypothetical protein A3E01_02765 [Gammaproteobacteria bacterium RIFCSPHIGHO2_12_FULL_63_22]
MPTVKTRYRVKVMTPVKASRMSLSPDRCIRLFLRHAPDAEQRMIHGQLHDPKGLAREILQFAFRFVGPRSGKPRTVASRSQVPKGILASGKFEEIKVERKKREAKPKKEPTKKLAKSPAADAAKEPSHAEAHANEQAKALGHLKRLGVDVTHNPNANPGELEYQISKFSRQLTEPQLTRVNSIVASQALNKRIPPRGERKAPATIAAADQKKVDALIERIHKSLPANQAELLEKYAPLLAPKRTYAKHTSLPTMPKADETLIQKEMAFIPRDHDFNLAMERLGSRHELPSDRRKARLFRAEAIKRVRNRFDSSKDRGEWTRWNDLYSQITQGV